ncbi:MAG: hypothetical protein K6A40_08560 [Solobacterium sp.]|nr:hypothetical protein [Solobacterium sp.]
MFFFSNYNTPGPGIDPDAPRAVGLSRIWEMISRDYVSFWLAGILNVLTFLPFLFLAGLGYATHSLLIALLGGVIGGIIAAPGFYGLADTLLRSLRDEPGDWWYRYSGALKNNWKKTLVPGIIAGGIFSVQIFILLHIPMLDMGFGMVICQIVSMTVFTGIFLWALAQQVLIELSVMAMIKNSLLLFFRYLPRSLAASLIAIAWMILVNLLFPGSVFLLLTAGLWLPMLCCMQIIYPTIDEIFGIEKALNEELAAKTHRKEM